MGGRYFVIRGQEKITVEVGTDDIQKFLSAIDNSVIVQFPKAAPKIIGSYESTEKAAEVKAQIIEAFNNGQEDFKLPTS